MAQELRQTTQRRSADRQCLEPGPQADGELVQRCLAGDVAAWSTLYEVCHEPLKTAIRRMLRNHSTDETVVEEIAARVWFSVVKEDARVLRRFNPCRNCRLITFLSLVAQVESRAFLRSERRLKARQTEASQWLPQSSTAENGLSLEFDEQFLPTLTPRERSFLDQELLGVSGAATFSPSNSWQLRHRVHEKLAAFFRQNRD